MCCVKKKSNISFLLKWLHTCVRYAMILWRITTCSEKFETFRIYVKVIPHGKCFYIMHCTLCFALHTHVGSYHYTIIISGVACHRYHQLQHYFILDNTCTCITTLPNCKVLKLDLEVCQSYYPCGPLMINKIKLQCIYMPKTLDIPAACESAPLCIIYL